MTLGGYRVKKGSEKHEESLISELGISLLSLLLSLSPLQSLILMCPWRHLCLREKKKNLVVLIQLSSRERF